MAPGLFIMDLKTYWLHWADPRRLLFISAPGRRAARGAVVRNLDGADPTDRLIKVT
jgi:hypothetical protein